MGIRFSCRRLGEFSLEMSASIPLWSDGVHRCYYPFSKNCLELPTTDIDCTQLFGLSWFGLICTGVSVSILIPLIARFI